MNIKLTFDFNKGQIIVEGSEGDLLKVAQEAKTLAPLLKEIRVITQQSETQQEVKKEDRADTQFSSGRKPSVRDFAKNLPLSNTYERIAAIAYHAIKIDGKASFSVKELGDWFGLCGFKKPAIMSVALSDAKRKYGYVDSKGRDQWTISTGGENVIMEMLEGNKAG